ncbi:MAG: hypothetical protein AVDCRST_MAG59-2575 [uncultured Thermomicrobiales bacterium]|uniref:Uncharacterized protein n=1 Tax=uncultured Thermomicrobiales bacterium TaxID=1645740 RepID=A0A6J4UW34_9BACT|nr:MAG: hypothetical protein AVDCRST_MAG59-2575 [uncultured Thermomicrobiales bacterium]
MFLYTREAHPGEHFPAHRTFAQKLAHARAFRERFAVERPILVDDLAGTGHQLYGLLPNMTYLIGRGGRVLFRADWTDGATVEAALAYLRGARDRRRDGLRLKPFYAEFAGYRWSDQAAFDAGLELAGPQAVADFAWAMEGWTRRGQVPGRIAVDEG